MVVATGFVAGVLSGAFGIGGGVVTTPAIRLVLGYPQLIAVGTPLLVIIPSAVTGAWSYSRAGFADMRVGLTVGVTGSLAAVLGAWLSDLAGGTVVILATAALIGYMATIMLVQTFRPVSADTPPATSAEVPVEAAPLVLLGVLTGVYSGFLGLGGGFVLVPLLSQRLGFPIKRAIGTSLVAIAILAVPGAVAHYLLGHVDLRLAAVLMIGVVPGALLGALITERTDDRVVRIAFALFLAGVGVALLLSELVVMAR
jgi:hypothetical protein